MSRWWLYRGIHTQILHQIRERGHFVINKTKAISSDFCIKGVRPKVEKGKRNRIRARIREKVVEA